MPKTTKKSKPAVKKTVTKSKPEPTVEQIIAEQVQQQLQEALLNIEIEVPLIKSINSKNDLIFFILLITYLIIFYFKNKKYGK